MTAPAGCAEPHPHFADLLDAQTVQLVAERERHRMECERSDPICDDRLRWRAQGFRQLCHVLPGQSILELGCGDGRFTRQLHRVARGGNPVTAVSFDPNAAQPSELPPGVEFISGAAGSASLAARGFDFVVAHGLLDARSAAPVLRAVESLLKPGGQVLFWESNPWSLMVRLRDAAARLTRVRGGGRLLSRSRLCELASEMGFVRVFAAYNDFVCRPLPRQALWLLRNTSILLENTPVIRHTAGSILLHGQKPPRQVSHARPSPTLAEHASLRHAVSVVIPCHNEEMNVGPLVTRLRELFDDYIHQIVLVDDNSSDGTRAAIGALAQGDPRITPVYRDPPKGVGRAIADGLRAASGEWVLTMDCDFQHLLPEVRDLFDAAALGGHDVVVGSRFSRHSVLLNYPFMKIVANRGFHALAQLVLRRRFRDLTNNLKLMKREVVERLELRSPHFAVNAETGLQPIVMGYDVKEVPISWINRTADMGTSSFRLLKVGGGYWRVLWDLGLRTLGLGAYRNLPVPVRRQDVRQQRGMTPRKATVQR